MCTDHTFQHACHREIYGNTKTKKQMSFFATSPISVIVLVSGSNYDCFRKKYYAVHCLLLRIARPFAEKVGALKEASFPAPPDADLSDPDCYVYPTAWTCPLKVIKQEILAAIR